MVALLSIKPKFVALIFDGTKKFEFRRVIFKNPVKKVVVYCSAPVRLIVGEFEVDGVLTASLDELWRATKHGSGISPDLFYSYFSEKENGHAIKIGNVHRYHIPKPLNDVYSAPPPQSFAYLNPDKATCARIPDCRAKSRTP